MGRLHVQFVEVLDTGGTQKDETTLVRHAAINRKQIVDDLREQHVN